MAFIVPDIRILRATSRLAGLAGLLLTGAIIVGGIFPFASESRRDSLRRWWSALTLRLLGVSLRVHGYHAAAGSLIVANHVSWLDALAINAVLPVSFVCKAEVRNWFLIGWLAERNGTVFIRRGAAMHARRVSARLSAELRSGSTVAVFPEGTTSAGHSVLGFRSALLQAAIDADVPVQPFALRYTDDRGNPSSDAPFVGDATFLASLLAVTGAPSTIVRVSIGARLAPRPDGRRELARAAREQIAIMLAATAAPQPPAPGRHISASPARTSSPTRLSA